MKKSLIFGIILLLCLSFVSAEKLILKEGQSREFNGHLVTAKQIQTSGALIKVDDAIKVVRKGYKEEINGISVFVDTIFKNVRDPSYNKVALILEEKFTPFERKEGEYLLREGGKLELGEKTVFIDFIRSASANILVNNEEKLVFKGREYTINGLTLKILGTIENPLEPDLNMIILKVLNGKPVIEKPIEISIGKEGEKEEECNGCLNKDVCFDVGARFRDNNIDIYCAKKNRIHTQKEDGEFCELNYECKENICVGGYCGIKEIIQKEEIVIKKPLGRIISFLKRVFGVI